MTSYIPQALPIEELDFRMLVKRVGTANAALARYDGLLQGIVNPAVMLSPLTVEEAVLSSRLEGTQATVDEVYEHEAGLVNDALGEGRKLDIQEVVNYRAALRTAQDYLQEHPISLHFIRAVHKILLNSVRGQNKSPGEFRNDQNWIGRKGCSIEEATFVPPSPLNLNDYLESWLFYVESSDVDILVQAAVMHAQFELLHPFKDGNGRIGRLLIPLFLYQKKCLTQPMFYLSSFLEQHRDEYCDALSAISSKKNWNGWIEFFLTAVETQAIENTERVHQIISLYNDMKTRIQEATRSQHTLQVLDQIFRKPIFKTSDFVTETKILKATAMTLLRQLKETNILREITPGSGRRAAVLGFPALLNITEGKKVL